MYIFTGHHCKEYTINCDPSSGLAYLKKKFKNTLNNKKRDKCTLEKTMWGQDRKTHPTPTAEHLKYCAYDDGSNNDELFVFEPDFQADAWICWQYMLFSHLNLLVGWIAKVDSLPEEF